MTDETRGNAPTIGEVGDDYVYVTYPDGSVHAVARAKVFATEKQNLPAKAEDEPERQYYVHLANGEHLRVAESDLPQKAGHDAPNGYWQRGNESHYVVGVYPVEVNV